MLPGMGRETSRDDRLWWRVGGLKTGHYNGRSSTFAVCPDGDGRKSRGALRKIAKGTSGSDGQGIAGMP